MPSVKNGADIKAVAFLSHGHIQSKMNYFFSFMLYAYLKSSQFRNEAV